MSIQSVFDRLPTEVQSRIFRFLMNGTKSGILSLMLVCRTWKEILYNTPRLWRCFDLHDTTTQEVADTWFKRANGIITSLRVDDGSLANKKQNLFRKAAKDFWSRVEELILGSAELFEYLPEETIRQLRVHSLVVESERSVDKDVWNDIRRLDSSNTRILAINVNKTRMELEALPFTMLTTLGLTGHFESGPFFELLRRNPTLETLMIVRKDQILDYDFSEADAPVRLPFLNRMELIGRGPLNAILRSVVTPNLGVLRIEKRYDGSPTLAVEAIHSQGITGVHQFYLRGWPVSVPALLALLQSWTSITTLKLAGCGFYEGDINSVIKALYEPASEAAAGAPSPILCPKLQYLDLSSSYRNLDADNLVTLVKSRNEKTTVATQEDKAKSDSAPIEPGDSKPLPIIYLSLDETRFINPRTIEWLRDAVPQFSYDVKPPKRVRKKS